VSNILPRIMCIFLFLKSTVVY